MKTRLIGLLFLLFIFSGSIAEPARIKFKNDGHQYTTFLAASLAGVDESDAYLLTFYSQYPDMDLRYSAVSVSLRYLFVPWKWDWRHDINEQLHSLHGGNADAVKTRRAALKKLIISKLKEESPDRLREAGLMIHAFADSYAHTKGELGSEEEKAFGKWVGHLFAGEAPDTIANPTTFPKYAQYLRDLFEVFSSGWNEERKKTLENYIATLRKHVGDSKAMTREILTQSTNLSNFDKTHFDSIADNPAFKLQPQQVQAVMDQIKNAVPSTTMAERELKDGAKQNGYDFLLSQTSDRNGHAPEIIPGPTFSIVGE